VTVAHVRPTARVFVHMEQLGHYTGQIFVKLCIWDFTKICLALAEFFVKIEQK
jgi:hypothetical protein